eukprot:TRINITY_DN41666_c0_g1_i1.p1 TRINITY_DN41666_c0_g1~~TRINITY_DN41666_c0_g1_i1.p1  ORF type:complete len:282 (-),score=14.57 TRINITY_DN41666_c0_g1_i1:36-881(-)
MSSPSPLSGDPVAKASTSPGARLGPIITPTELASADVQLDIQESAPRVEAVRSHSKGLLGFLSCQRRATASRETQQSRDALVAAYEGLLEEGRNLPADLQEAFSRMCWWSDATGPNGSDVFVLIPRGLDGQLDGPVDIWRLFVFALTRMHDLVVRDNRSFTLVWVQAGDHKLWLWSALQLTRKLHERYRQNLVSLHVVHPSWTIRAVELLLWPIVEEEFWDIFQCHERVEFLGTYFDLDKLALPGDVMEYDSFLDKEAEFLTQTAGDLQGQASSAYFPEPE